MEERRRDKKRRGGSRDRVDHHRGGGGSGVVAATVVVAAEKVVVVTPTTAVGVTAVAEAEEARVGLAVARDAATGAASDEVTEAVASALGEATVDGRTAREAVQPGMARRPPSARLRPRARTTAR